jgi:hypothetical protein
MILQPSGTYVLGVKNAIPAGPNGRALGQTIKVPTDGNTRLVSFGFGLAHPSNVLPWQYLVELYAWDGTKATGPNLFESGPTNFGPITANGTPDPIVDTGGIDLTAGQEYVIFANLLPGLDHIYHTSGMVPGSGPGYSDGSTVFIDSSDPSVWTSQAWTVGDPDLESELAPGISFIATFTTPDVTAPEPSALLLLSLGSGCVAVFRAMRTSCRPRAAA